MRLPVLLLVLLAGLALAAPAQAEPGARSAGDRLFPGIGNGGYDALHYDLNLRYDPGTDVLQGRATMSARVTQRTLSELSLDLEGFTVSRVAVNGREVAFAREGTKLIVTPRRALRLHRVFRVRVSYEGVPVPITDPDGSKEGWFATDDGAFVVGEPIGSQGWFPNNNTPADKATYSVRTTVPEGITVVGNGSLVGVTARGEGRTTWHWRERHPMASYLATATLGRFDVTRARAGRVEVFDAIDSLFTAEQKQAARTALANEPGILAAFEARLGRYPFDTVGAAVDRADFVGYALESQSISNYDRPPAATTVAHEIAHQWFGNSVTPREWVDIWLNEGFANWLEWDWGHRADGRPSPAEEFAQAYARPEGDALWRVAPGSPAADEIFDQAIYTRGAMTLEALRQIVGDPTFERILRSWHAEHRYGNAGTADFIALVERESGRELSAFFTDWLYESGKPALLPADYAD